jgi:hypothetical protein
MRIIEDALGVVGQPSLKLGDGDETASTDADELEVGSDALVEDVLADADRLRRLGDSERQRGDSSPFRGLE